MSDRGDRYKPENILETAKQGDARAQLGMGLICYSENDVESQKEAFKWFYISAEQGPGEETYTSSCLYLGHLYFQGMGTLPDYTKAMEWYKKVVEQENEIIPDEKKTANVASNVAIAQCQLGLMYYEGKGVPKDIEKSREWFKKAADGGDEQAKKNLRILEQESGSCYVATCAYGSYDCPEVQILRRFRDDTLKNIWFGRLFVCVYYAISPPIVHTFGNKVWFNRLCKSMLNKIITGLQKIG